MTLYTFQAPINDHVDPDLSVHPDANYSMPVGYQTVRYPFSGLVGTADDAAKTKEHNDPLYAQGQAATNDYLNKNVKEWLDSAPNSKASHRAT